ncbi:hypothetical protein [Vibrio japonicus]|uniref:Uncharacterized protein n=1 Tax=Vibrio japonicus TaxID=1824638 RepID=A0ABY5LML6_9VIBR|nr:hypothetical protein [Vibrio japonicus]UUM32145.1 hypothetical protein NP165_17765 [Vibrio japonicus]
MQIENFLLAITTFFSVAQLTCVITVPDYNNRLNFHFFKCYIVTALIMLLTSFLVFHEEKVAQDVSASNLLMYLAFLLFVHKFNGYLADKIESTKDSVSR